jgi:hypothetical protein
LGEVNSVKPPDPTAFIYERKLNFVALLGEITHLVAMGDWGFRRCAGWTFLHRISREGVVLKMEQEDDRRIQRPLSLRRRSVSCGGKPKMGSVVPLRELQEAQRRARVGVCVVREFGGHSHQRGNHEIHLFEGSRERVLRALRLDTHMLE